MRPQLLLTLLVLTIIGSSILHLSAAQSCGVVTTHLCNPMTPPGTVVFVPQGYTIDFIELAALRTVQLINLATTVLEPCRTYGIQMVCATWLRPCYVTPENVTLPIPQQTCTSLCNATYEGCSLPGRLQGGIPIGEGTYFPKGYSAPIDCTSPPIDKLAYNTSLYWPTNTSVLYAGANYSVPCNQPELVPVPIPQICESPLEANNVGGCSFSCPLPSLSDSQYDNVKTMQGVLGWFSWSATAALILFLVLCPRARAFPRNMIIMTACAANIAAAAIIMPTYAGYDNVWCGGGAQVHPTTTGLGVDDEGLPLINFSLSEDVLDFSSSLCTFQGAMLQFGFLAAVFWWALIAFNMCLELYFGEMLSLEKSKWKWLRFGIYNLLGWGSAFLLMVIPAAAGEIVFSPAATYCFVSIANDNNAWSLTFWFLPVGIAMLAGTLLFLLALVRITVLFVTIRKMKKLLFLYLRLFIFIFLYLILIVFIMAYYIQNANNQAEINQGYQIFYQCLAYGQPDCSLDDTITNYNLVMLKSFAISSLGLLLFFVFLSWDVMKFWWGLGVSVYYLITQRTKSNAMVVLHKLAYTQTTKTITKGTGSGLSVTMGQEMDEGEADPSAEDDEDEDREMSKKVSDPDNDLGSESSSSSESL